MYESPLFHADGVVKNKYKSAHHTSASKTTRSSFGFFLELYSVSKEIKEFEASFTAEPHVFVCVKRLPSTAKVAAVRTSHLPG